MIGPVSDYTILKESEMPDLIDRVCQCITLGWEPLGSPFADGGNHISGRQWCQAMVKREGSRK
ncbi:DUF1737 domain-containing protein [Nitrosomonas sp. Nm58]|uniref:DUF1737 domain-containing protein n=1 Tax=Nitrosomonas sp. Nm58 TaxID=200126 RepID=UPI000894B53A|nr:DUF1737 domain-containing protein [Nitrosomonas sp. Nm58]SDY38122.1 protein of unknown function [Nitrosomonas sp. Nm58]